MSTKVARIVLGSLCAAAFLFGLVLPLMSVYGYGLTYVNMGKLEREAGTIFGILFWPMALMWIATAVLAFIFPLNKKIPGIVGIITGASSILTTLIVLILCIASISESYYTAKIGAGAIIIPMLCIGILVFAILTLKGKEAAAPAAYDPYGRYNQNPQYNPDYANNQYNQYNQNPQYNNGQYNQNAQYPQYNQNGQYPQYNQNPQYPQYNQNPQYNPNGQYNQNDQNGQYN